MELKLGWPCPGSMRAGRLLIVPYGIETCKTRIVYRTSCTLLIVPYGIETTVTIIIGEVLLSTFNRTLWN